MKRGKHYRKRTFRFPVRKSIILGAVSLILVCLISVSSTVSWIEEVSKVEFNSNEGQATPLHIGNRILLSDAVMEKKNASTAVNLNHYFNQSGDMHLSPCYSDGENFYFPIENGTNNATGYRIGTKDDANVNYLSVTFRVQSIGAATAYWFEKTGNTPYVSFKNKTGVNPQTQEPIYADVSSSDNNTLSKYLRCSITVDGATNVYCIDDSNTPGYQKSYTTIENNATTTKTGRSVEEYSYYDEEWNSDGTSKTSNSSKPNQGAGSNLNGNTLFTVNKFDTNEPAATTKTVTFKLWLEAGTYEDEGGARISDVDLSSIHLNMVSGWEKTRRIYVVDNTIDQWDTGLNAYTGSNWLTSNNATLHWAIKGNEQNAHWNKIANIGNVKKQYFDIPAVYNNTACYLYRCNNGWNRGNGQSPLSYWDRYETVFPNTFHSETYAVYTKTFGTWDGDVHYVKMLNTGGFSQAYAYMWDSNSVYGNNEKVVENAPWYGVEMLKMNESVTITDGSKVPIYGFYYNSDYDYIIFNDVSGGNRDEYQTQDLAVRLGDTSWENKYFDIASLVWFNSAAGLPSYGKNFLHSNFTGTNRWVDTRFGWTNSNLSPVTASDGNMFNGTSGDKEICRFYIKSDGYFEFSVNINGTYHGANTDNHMPTNTWWDLKSGEANLKVDLTTGIYRFYLRFKDDNNNSVKQIYYIKES